MTPHTPKNLLRRTSLALVALAAAWIAVPAPAVTIKLGGSSAGETCTYTGTTVDPVGNVTVTCSAQATGGMIGSSPTPPPPTTGPDTLTLTASVSTVATGGTFNAVLTRTGTPSTGPVGVNLAVIGACSSTSTPSGGGGSLTLQPTDAGPFNIPVVAGSSAGTCTILYNIGYGGAVVSGTTQLNIPVGASTTPPATGGGGGGGGGGGVPTVSGCPTPASGTVMAQFPATPGQHVFNTNDGSQTFSLPPGQIGAVQLPSTVNNHASGIIKLTYNVGTVASLTGAEISISKCPGVIDPTGTLTGMNPNRCYALGSIPEIDGFWYGKLVNGVTASSTGACMALEGTGPYYANIRYSFTGAGCSGTCGMQLEWGDYFP